MKKIGILTCMLSNKVCTRMSCLNAFQNKSDFFQEYKDDTYLVALMTCNGCRFITEAEPKEDPEMQEKIDRLINEDVSVVHVGACRIMKDQHECCRITQICQLLEDRGIQVIRGTHRE